jgi:CHAT domain-containing protein/tetratricopeptide (TPR) repeat protein
MLKTPWLLVLCLAVVAVSTDVSAQFVPPNIASMMRPPGIGDLKQAREAADAERWEDAANAYARAVASLNNGHPAMAQLSLMGALPAYGRVLLRLNRLDEAEQILSRAVEVQSSANGGAQMPEQLRVLQGVMSMANESVRASNRQMLVFDSETAERVDPALAPRLPDARQALTLLAEVYARKGDRDKVIAIWRGPFADYLRTAANADPQLREVLATEAEIETTRMGHALAVVGAYEQARAALSEALHRTAGRLQFLASTGSLDPQLGGFQQRRLLVSSLVQQTLRSPDVAVLGEPLVAAIASSRALGARYSQHRRALLASDADPAFAAVRNRLATLDRDLLSLPQIGEAGVRAWADWSNAYHAALAPARAGLVKAGLQLVTNDGLADLQAMRRQLGEAGWIGFMQYHDIDPASSTVGEARYLRYTVSSSGIAIKDLGPRRPIDQAVTRWRGGVDRVQGGEGDTLFQLLLADLGEDMHRRKTWLIEPDGMLSLLPFEALPDPQGGLLVSRHTMRYATSISQFARQSIVIDKTEAFARVIVDAQYAGPSGKGSESAGLLRTATGQRLRDLQLSPLPDTRDEGAAVAKALATMQVKVDIRAGEHAGRSAFDFNTAPRFLHVATHGFLLSPAADTDPLFRSRLSLLVPGTLAGLALTPDADGGFLMAQDLAGLNLRGTQLLVLSACDTGNGLVNVGEGVDSLRRAAEEAGVRATLTSLWPVPSQMTTRLMGDFYAQLAAGHSHSEALQAAKLKVVAAGGTPRDWAGFVLAGADR